ncbi:MAG: Uncharacterized protein FD135_4584 [Comamonadaceae bacterium]|nr:MAG: Uncharacterized protein FD135_4584 [Comamonadaceae bacterium]
MSASTHPGFRIFVLGAGFSRAAGLPVASELFPLVRQHIIERHGSDTKFDRDLQEYLDYSNACGYSGQSETNLDLERLMSYLDIEHYLGFRGSKTWSSEGNESQLMIRKAIGYVIHSHTPAPDAIPDVYLRFADSLSIHDTVLTLNYDLLLERALTAVGKPFRRYPNRFESINEHGGTLDSNTEEVVLLKLHGSIDWFDDRQFLELKASLSRQNIDHTPIHSVFDKSDRYAARPLVDGLLPDGDALRHLHAIERVDDYYYGDSGFNAPFLLSPSHVKFVYAEPILSFWHGIGRSGGYNLGVSVIGFSLPEHDEYIRIGLYQVLSNYGSWWESPMFDGVLKDYVRFVDYRPTTELQNDYKQRYSFAKEERSKFHFGGFGADAIDFLFGQSRKA